MVITLLHDLNDFIDEEDLIALRALAEDAGWIPYQRGFSEADKKLRLYFISHACGYQNVEEAVSDIKIRPGDKELLRELQSRAHTHGSRWYAVPRDVASVLLMARNKHRFNTEVGFPEFKPTLMRVIDEQLGVKWYDEDLDPNG